MMIKMRHGASFSICAAALAVLCTMVFAGCGGGGGGSTPPGGTPPGIPPATTATITGVLQDQPTSTLLVNRTVTVQGTTLSGISNSQGQFSIAGVPLSSITLIIRDSNGAANGQYTVNVSTLSGSPRNLGTILLNVSGSVPPPPF